MSELELMKMYEKDVKNRIESLLSKEDMDSVMKYIEGQIGLIQRGELSLPEWLSSRVLLKNVLEIILRYLRIKESDESVAEVKKSALKVIWDLYLRVVLELELLKAEEYVKVINFKYLRRRRLPEVVEIKEDIESELRKIGLIEYRIPDDFKGILRYVGKDIRDLRTLLDNEGILRKLLDKGLVRLVILPTSVDLFLLRGDNEEIKINVNLAEELIRKVSDIDYIRELYGEELDRVLNIFNKIGSSVRIEKKTIGKVVVQKVVQKEEEERYKLRVSLQEGALELIGKSDGLNNHAIEFLKSEGFDIVEEGDLIKFRKKVDNIDTLLNSIASLRNVINIEVDDKSPSWFKALVEDPELAEFLQELRNKITQELDVEKPIPNVKVWEIAISLGYTYEDTYKHIGKLVQEG
ncbi:MAG: hypothetical protein J7J99_05965, partial [Thermoprotei archaeon]|nr:hypothetical protein [Thermoprotei archaeon]